MAHVMFGGLTHSPAIDLARLLVELTPYGLDKVFFSDSGSVAVEVAIKMAVQYWQAKNKAGKHRILSLSQGYHGDTFATMAVSDPKNGMHHLFSDVLNLQLFAPSPQAGFEQAANTDDLTAIEDLLQQHQHELAAFIVEPIVQGAGGMKFYSPDYLTEIRRLCDQYKVLLIADEIATGFGRTGKLFACEHANISPDILCLGKALTGGYMTLAATLCSDEIATTISNGEAGVFMHGPTFMANPLACATACASINLLVSNNWQKEVLRIEQGLLSGFMPAQALPGVKAVRVLGAIGVIELEQSVDMAIIQAAFVDAGVWIRPFGKLVYVMPPFIMSDADLQQLTSKTLAVLTDYLQQQKT
jgi:adenosylmethionine-8-amino-7-oxononanoate aminotransferase